MDVQVLLDAGAGDFAQVHANIETVRVHGFCQGVLAAACELEEVLQFLVGQRVQVSGLFIRYYHQMAPGIRIRVQQRITRALADQDVVGLVIVGAGDAREEALPGRGRLGRQDVFDSPRGVQRFHPQKL